MNTKKTKKAKAKKFSFALPQREGELLALYAKEHSLTRPEAARRILRDFLRQYRSAKPKLEPDNQLGLFDSLQIDIFDNTSKVKKD